jgi:hypothetical protein
MHFKKEPSKRLEVRDTYRMERDLTRGLAVRVVVIALGATVIYWALPDSGTAELKKMRTMMESARSWRIDTMVSEPTKKLQSTVEVYCPSRVHEVTNGSREEGGKQFEESSESYWIEGTLYAKKGSQWALSQEERSRTASCVYGPRSTDALLDRLDWVISMGKVRKGHKRTVNGELCRDWIASVRAPTGWREDFRVCVGDDGLPREVFTPDRQMVETYSEWNVPIRIEAPVAIGVQPVDNLNSK